MNDLTSVLQGVISQAAKTLPRNGGECTRLAKRQVAAIEDRTCVVCDVSGSMAERAGAKRKIDLLREAVRDVWAELDHPHLFSFASGCASVPAPEDLPEPAGGTDLAGALRKLGDWTPGRTIVISDGQPDNEADALAAADALSGRIDVIYCGPDGDATAIAFMQRLARTGAGSCVVHDVVRQANQRILPDLRPAVRRALGLPAPKGA